MVIRRLVLALFFVAPSASAQSRADIAAAYGGTIPPQCASAYVDLAHIAQCRCVIRPQPFVVKGQTMISARQTCGDAIDRRAIANLVDLDVSVAPSPVHGGDPMTVVVSIKNTSNADVPVVLGEGPWLQNALSMRDASGAEMARGGGCFEGFSGSLATYLVVLPPAGIAEWRLPWQAATRVTDGACTPSWRPLAPGGYELSVPLQLFQIPNAKARGTMIVQ
jgi:hypothetical protein